MSDMTDLRERINAAMRRAALAGKTDPAQELHEAIMCSFPGAPLTDLEVTTKTEALPQTRGKPEIITWVTITATTSAAGAYYLAEIANQLAEENG
nr:MAG TPA: hypothetical protein [Caudoviricetes sp.]